MKITTHTLVKFVVCSWLVFLTSCTFVPQPAPPTGAASVQLRESISPPFPSKWGYDVLALAKYCDRYLNAPRLPKVSTLLRTFGDPLPCIDKALARGGITDVQYNLRDATCWRNKVCPRGTPSLTDWNDMRRLASQVNRRAVAHPEVQHWISPYLEHDFKDANVIKRACEVSLSACPTCKCVNEPFSGTKNTPFPLELHGTKVTAWSVSGDGASMFDGDNIRDDGNNFQHRTSGTTQTYGWWNALNLRCQGEKTFTPIERRTARPTDDHFKQAYKTLTTEEDPIPSAPARCKSVRTVSKPEILKPNAEKYCNGQPGENDSRGDKPLLIIKKGGKRGDKIRVYNSNGKDVGCFAYYGTYETPGTHRWYVGNCSGQKPYELYKALQNEWGFVDLGKGQCLRINALRRMGTYR